MDQDPVAESLALFAARCTDPATAVYARLFALHPEAESLFLMDPGGHVRGQMLAVAVEALLDGGERLAGLVGIERMNHVNIGVPPALFDGFFGLLQGWSARRWVAIGLPRWRPAGGAAGHPCWRGRCDIGLIISE
ncbi:hypothetical protein [Dankookia sp. P2]|uniref:hypothetical protein n=1 Tax=Dankookia sp. P2 TaxID=3423955 RepID=UPI003D672F0B